MSPLYPNMTRELTTFVKTFIEPAVTSKLLVLDIYMITNMSYEVIEWDYGNLKSNRKIIKQP